MKKRCGATGCDEPIRKRHYFCRPCMSRLPHKIRSDVMDARLYANGHMVLQALASAKKWFEQYPKTIKENDMDNEKEVEMVTIDAESRLVKGKGVALHTGKYEETAQGDQREVWTWVPQSQVTDNGDNTFTMPEWLAKDKGLI